MRVNFDLKAKFLAIIIVATLVIGTLVSFVTTTQLRDFFLESAKTEFTFYAQRHATKYFNLTRQSSLKISGDYKEYAKTLKESSKDSTVSLAEPSGLVIYSDNAYEIDSSLINDSSFISALQGNTTLNNVDLKKKTADVVSPIKGPDGSIRGVVIASISFSDTLSHADTFSIQLLVMIGCISLFFVILSFIIFTNTNKSIEEQGRSVEDKSRALEEERELDEAILSSIAESLIVINKEGQIVLFNPEAEKITGHKVEEVEYRLYKKILLFCDKDGKEMKDNPIANCLNTAKRVEINIKDGYFLKNTKKTLVPVSISVAPILAKDDRVRGVAATIQDISVGKELDRIKDEFVYVVAHELGNPVFAIDGYLSILQDKSKTSSKETKEIIRSLRGLNQQLSALVNDLLEAVRNEGGHLSFELCPIMINEVIKDVTKSASFKAKGKKINLHYLEAKLPNVLCNEGKIKEVIINLVDNAIKYTPSGGNIEIFHEIKDETVVTHIKDNGFGMSNEEQEKLFEKFYRVKNIDTKNISGTGLGLFICKQIIEKSGGKIWVHSAKDKGSDFSFSLNITKKQTCTRKIDA